MTSRPPRLYQLCLMTLDTSQDAGLSKPPSRFLESSSPSIQHPLAPPPPGSLHQAQGGQSPSLRDTGTRARRRTVLGGMAGPPAKVETRKATVPAAPECRWTPPHPAPTPAGTAQARAGRGVGLAGHPQGCPIAHARAGRRAPCRSPSRPVSACRWLQAPPPRRASQPLSAPAVAVAAAARPSAAGPEAGDPARGQRAGRRRPGAEGR